MANGTEAAPKSRRTQVQTPGPVEREGRGVVHEMTKAKSPQGRWSQVT